ncbi:hypothetical protein FB451DRAFT_1398220 [Mycena latifolia]|nr:hypothetical protein FB451DRAFT_1398220 [Mycena latifolia]
MPARIVTVSSSLGLAYQCRLRVSEHAEVVGYNTERIPHTLASLDFPPGVSPGIRCDGSWGPHEYTVLPQLFSADSPYMAWIPVKYDSLDIPHRISTFVAKLDPSASQFRPNAAWPSRGSIDPELLTGFQDDVNTIYTSVTAAFKRVGSHTALDGIRLPLRAVERSYASLLALRVNFLTRRDVLEYVACLKRSIAELQGFLLWSADLEQWLNPTSVGKKKSYSRGVVCEDQESYNTMCRLGIPAWCFVSGLPPTSCSTLGAWEVVSYPKWSSSVLHNKALFFYPPVVKNLNEFELAARGYAPRVDVLHRDKGYRKDLGAMEELYDKLNRERYNVKATTGLSAPETSSLDPAKLSRAIIAKRLRFTGTMMYNLNFSALVDDLGQFLESCLWL